MLWGLWCYRLHQSELKMVQLPPDSSATAYPSVFRGEVFKLTLIQPDPHQRPYNYEVLQRGVKKNKILWRSNCPGNIHFKIIIIIKVIQGTRSKKTTPDSLLIAVSDFKDPPLWLGPLISTWQRFWVTAASWWKGGRLSSFLLHAFHVCAIALRISFRRGWIYRVHKKKKKIISPLPSGHIVPSNILEKKCWQWGPCGGRGYRTPAREAASHAGSN